MKPIKYTLEQEEEMAALYSAAETEEERDAVVDLLVDKYNRDRKKIIAKLSSLRVYVKKVKTSKVTGGKPETKEQLVRRLEIIYGYDPMEFEGLEKAPKTVLLKLLEEFRR